MIQQNCNHKPTRTYTDAPAKVTLKTGGIVELDSCCNVMVHWTTTHLQNPDLGAATLAVRWALNGQRFFESGNRRFAVDDSAYRVFNEGSQFSSTIQSRTPVECYSVCFQSSLANEILTGLVTPDDQLLDDPKRTQAHPIQFVEKTSPHDSIVTPVLKRLERYKDSELATHGWFEEQFRQLLVALLEAHRGVHRDVENVPAARAATRVELYKRLQQARDFMEAGLDQPLTILEIAQAAWFSPYHFLRLFKQVFGETPHQYLTRRRLERAQSLLKNTDQSVTDICFAVGFESLGSFSWLFRRHLGVSPDRFRNAHRRNGLPSTLQPVAIPFARQIQTV